MNRRWNDVNEVVKYTRDIKSNCRIDPVIVRTVAHVFSNIVELLFFQILTI